MFAQANYRPPSEKGVMIPTCDNMYNVDPQKPKPRNRFKISQVSIHRNPHLETGSEYHR